MIIVAYIAAAVIMAVGSSGAEKKLPFAQEPLAGSLLSI
jgi:hypothetical protein